MRYFLFNKEVYLSEGGTVRLLEKGSDLKSFVGDMDLARACVVDVDIIITAAPENPVEKKDSVLVRKFKQLYQNEAYIIQDEKIDHNLFQVIGIKEQKVREIYSILPPQKLESVVPYGIALRNILIQKKCDLGKPLVFIDDLEKERLITVFDGLKFSRTRIMAKGSESLLPEIKRSVMDFFKKIEEFTSHKIVDYVVMVNDQDLAQEILNDENKLNVHYLDVQYPAIEGLKELSTDISYKLPEEIIKNKRRSVLKKNLTSVLVSLGVIAAGLIYFLFNKGPLCAVSNQGEVISQTNQRLNQELATLDKAIYRDDLKRQKLLNYGVSYLSLLQCIPSSYELSSFKFYKTAYWNFEASFLVNPREYFEPILISGNFKNSQVKDFYMDNRPGKRIKIIYE